MGDCPFEVRACCAALFITRVAVYRRARAFAQGMLLQRSALRDVMRVRSALRVMRAILNPDPT